MATVSKCGMNGSVSLGGEVTAWNISLEEDIPEVTSMASDGFREYIPCLKSASGNFDTVTVAGVIGAHASVSFENDIETISMNIIVTDVEEVTDVADKVTWKYSLVSTGPVTVTPK